MATIKIVVGLALSSRKLKPEKSTPFIVHILYYRPKQIEERYTDAQYNKPDNTEVRFLLAVNKKTPDILAFRR